MEPLETWPTGRLLSAAARLVEHEWNAHLARWDLNHAGLAVLHVLGAGAMTQRELAGAVQVEDQTMSRTVERLERSGYVERRRDDADRRRVVVSITDAGRRTYLRASDVEVAEGFFTDCVADVEALRRALVAVVRHRSRKRWPDAASAASSSSAVSSAGSSAGSSVVPTREVPPPEPPRETPPVTLNVG